MVGIANCWPMPAAGAGFCEARPLSGTGLVTTIRHGAVRGTITANARPAGRHSRKSRNSSCGGNGDSEVATRVNKMLADRGVCSRRQADRMLLGGRVMINGCLITQPGLLVHPGDTVTLDGKAVSQQKPQKYYFALNKPKGYTCTAAPRPGGERIALSLLDDWIRRWKLAHRGQPSPRFFTVGRLDKQSVGLIFATNDGDWAHRVTHPSAGVTKEYSVTLTTKPTQTQMKKIAQGAEIEPGVVVVPLSVTYDDTVASKPNRLRIVLCDGRSHEVRKLVAIAGLTLTTLRRTRIGTHRLDPQLPFGAVVELSALEARRVLAGG